MALTRPQLIAEGLERFADSLNGSVTGESIWWFLQAMLNYQDHDGTYDVGNNLATFATPVIETTNWNTLDHAGIWAVDANFDWDPAKNGPVGSSNQGVLLVLGVGTGGTARVTQIYMPHDNTYWMFRTKAYGTWSPWRYNGRYDFPFTQVNDTWVLLGVFAGGIQGEACEIKIVINQEYFAGETDYNVVATIALRNGNGAAGHPNIGGLFYNEGGGARLLSRVKDVKLAPVSGAILDKAWRVYVKVDRYSGLGYYTVQTSPGTSWSHDGTVVGPVTLSMPGQVSTVEKKVVNSPLIALGRVNVPNLGTYASDAAAGTGGLITGDFYKDSSGTLKVKA